jgi:hypothetical protein
MPYIPADNGYENHVIAIKEAARLVPLLPSGAVWSVFISNEDNPQTPGVLNVYVPTEAARLRIRALLGFGTPDDEVKSELNTFESHAKAALLLVSIEEENT